MEKVCTTSLLLWIIREKVSLADLRYGEDVKFELGRVELVQAAIASINIDPEDEEGEEAETLPESNS